MKILYKYPKAFTLKDGQEVLIRPLRKEDEQALVDYFSHIPEKERAWLKNNVSETKVIKSWIYDLDYDSNLPIVAFDNGRIAAIGSLHFSSIAWTKHQAEIRVTCDIDYREKGLASILINNMVEIAKASGLEQLTAETSPHLHEAYFLFEKLLFKEAALLKDFLKNQEGKYEDLVLMVKNL